MSCCGTPPTLDELDEVSRLVSREARRPSCGRCATTPSRSACAKGRTPRRCSPRATATSPACCARPSSICSRRRKADWEKFDGIFDAFWLGRRVRSRVGGRRERRPTPTTLRQEPARTAGQARRRQRARPGPVRRRGRRHGPLRRGPRGRRLARREPRRDRFPQDRRPRRRSREAHAARRAARARHAHAADPPRPRAGGAATGSTCAAPSTATSAMAACRSAWCRRRRKEKPLRLVMLLDASGSMSMYTGVFLRFIHGVLDSFREAEAFLFHTRLAHVSDAMKEKDAARALDRLSLMAQGAGGGTRIGESLATFNRWHARARDPFAHLRDDRLGRLRDRRRRAARPRDGGARAPLPPHRLAQPDDGLGGLRARGRRHQGGAAACRSASRRPIRWRASPRSNPIWQDCDGGDDDRPCRRAGSRFPPEGGRASPSRWRPWCAPSR